MRTARSSVQPWSQPVQQAAGKRIAGTKHVQDLDSKRRNDDRIVARTEDDRPLAAAFQDQRLESERDQPLRGGRGIVLAGGGTELFVGPDGKLRGAQQRAHMHAEMRCRGPLTGTVVDVDDDARAGCASTFGREDRRGAARLVTEPGAGDHDDARAIDGCPAHIIEVERAVRAIIPIERQGEFVGRLNAHDHRACPAPGFARNEPRLHAFTLEECQNEVGDLVLTHRSQQRRP